MNLSFPTKTALVIGLFALVFYVLYAKLGPSNQSVENKVHSMSEIPVNPKVVLETNHGNIVLQLDSEKAPITAANFVFYVRSDFFKDTIFHRVIPGFMIQGGGFTRASGNLEQKSTEAPIKNEASNKLKNEGYTVAMARTQNPDSATAQFFINLQANSFLNYDENSNPGYAVFGKVVEGQDVVDKIAKVDTANESMHENVPKEDVTITSAYLKED